MKGGFLRKEIECIINEFVVVKLGIKKINDKLPEDACKVLLSKMETVLKRACEKKVPMDIKVVGKYHCSFCSKEVKTEILHCGHFICKECVLNLIKIISDEKFNDSVWEIVCPKCNLQITKKTILSFFSYEDIAIENKKAISKRATKKCRLCLIPVILDGSISYFGCAHAYHDNCFKSYMANKINARKITPKDLCCPRKSCNAPISSQVLQAQLTPELWEKYIKYKRMVEHPDYKACPLCDYDMQKSEAIFKCKNKECKRYDIETCSQCGSMPYHKGETCEQNKLSQEINNKKEEFKKIQIQNGFRDCPKCGMFVSKTGGCNCITCRNPDCKTKNGDVFFCYLCGVPIKSHADSSHFTNDPNSYSGKTCLTLKQMAEEKKIITS